MAENDISSPDWLQSASNSLLQLIGIGRSSSVPLKQEESLGNAIQADTSADAAEMQDPPSTSSRTADPVASDGDEDTLNSKLIDSLEYLEIYKPSESPIERVKDIVRLNDFGFRGFEWAITSQLLSTAFVLGILVGGYRKHKEIMKRFLDHNRGTLYQNTKEGRLRMMDFTFFMFLKHGFIFSAKVCTFLGITMGVVTPITAYRDRFSFLYVPLGTGVAGAMHRVHMGPRAMIVAGVTGVVFGCFIPLIVVPTIWILGSTSDQVYKEGRQMYFAQMLEKRRYQAEINKIMKEEGHWFPFEARKRVQEKKMEHQGK